MTTYTAIPPHEDGTIPFSTVENDTWHTLIKRQHETIKGRACDEFFIGLDKLNMSTKRVPGLNEISDVLSATGWKVTPVLGTILVDEFFTMLKNREFPVATFIRIPEELDYLKQPDIFHEYFGHCPMLTNQAYADFVQWYGEFACSLNTDLRKILSRLFWFTIEFGLVQTANGLRVYGGGILSSHAETIYSLESDIPERKPFNLHEVLLTPYKYDEIQKKYFVIDSLEHFYHMMDDKALLSALSEIKTREENPFITC